MARRQEVEISTRLGRRRISTDKVIYFPRGLAGFENEHQFTLLQIRPEAPLLVLQSTENPAVGLLVADPYSFWPEYSITVGDAEQKLLRLKNIRQVAVLVTASIPPGKPELTALNLTGPILINHSRRVGLQVPQADGDGPARIYLQPDPDGNPRIVAENAEDNGEAPKATRKSGASSARR
jgi:flagellar assembly factor FliW